jgi:hypothetical protein
LLAEDAVEPVENRSCLRDTSASDLQLGQRERGAAIEGGRGRGGMAQAPHHPRALAGVA